MNRISAIAVEKSISELIEDVKRGESFVITQQGAPVAEMIPLVPETAKNSEQGKAILRLKSFFEKGVPLGGKKFDREELYDR